MSAYTLHLEQASSAHTLTDAQAMQDALAALNRGADVVSFTEVQERHYQLDRACHVAGYQLLLPSRGDVALALRSIHKPRSQGTVPVQDAVGHDAHTPAHTARVILWGAFSPFGTDDLVTVHSAHWVTRRADTGGQQLELTQALGDVVAQHSRGARLGFWLGDTNSPDRPRDHSPVDRALRRADLTSCWDELGAYPDTHGQATLDVVGSYDPDRRVSCLRAHRWPQGHSDHRAVSAFYRVRQLERP